MEEELEAIMHLIHANYSCALVGLVLNIRHSDTVLELMRKGYEYDFESKILKIQKHTTTWQH
jgi:hypothetical protein